MNQTEIRKQEHIKISLEENVSAHHNPWDDVHLIHNALPEINEEDIDTTTTLFNKILGAPIIISGMTGGTSQGKTINDNLAHAAEHFQLGMGVGSQRAALENTKLKETYNIINNYDIPLKIANIGASQLVLWDKPTLLNNAQTMVDMIDADVLAVCLNFLQEIVQPEGEAHAKGCLEAIQYLADNFDTPILIKESGAGISEAVALQLATTRIKAIDVGGAGGTSFSAVEYYRAELKDDELNRRLGKTFWDWGIPTPQSILSVGKATQWNLPIIATGGIRNGLDAAKALVLGANAAGIAHSLLSSASTSKDQTLFEIQVILKELRTSLFLIGTQTIEDISNVEVHYGP